VASIDQVSNGRFLFGIGAGWNAEEMEDHGTAFKTRFKLMHERVDAMRAIWTQSKPQYHGEFVNFDAMMTWPKPVQKPHPPVLVGGNFPHGAKRALAFGDAWMPLASMPQYADIAEFIPRFRQLAAEAGRDPASVPVQVNNVGEDPAKLARYRELGAIRAVISLASEKADTILPILDRWAALIPKAR